MMIIGLSLAFWLLTFVVLARLRRTGNSVPASHFTWALLITLACVILFRPHEDILGGQDGGAYLGFGARLGRVPSLTYQDELLARVQPPGVRSQFLLYGPGRPYLSKFACGQVTNLETGQMRVWFQPAYPIVMSAVSRFGRPEWVLYVLPFFTLCAGLALAALAGRLIPHRSAAPLAFLLYSLCPLVAWHGRQPRPELIASFLLLAGITLLLSSAPLARWRRWPDVALGALCIALAPLFHITAWMVVLPAGIILAVAAARGRDDYLPACALLGAGLALFAWQTVAITDTYSLRRFIAPLAAHPLAAVALAATALALLAVVSQKMRNRVEVVTGRPSRLPALINFACRWLVPVAFVATWLVSRHTRPAPGAEQTLHYLYPTDLATVLRMLSPAIGLLGLLGLTRMAASPAAGAAERRLALVALLPACLLIGNMYDFFMTRYMLVALVPATFLGLTWLLCALPVSGCLLPPLRLIPTGIVLGLMLSGRTTLLTTVELRGLTSTMKSLATRIQSEHGILLFEYPRAAAPLDHIFGVPVLALNNERDQNYGEAEAAWERIIRESPDRPAFFIAPFQPPISDRFSFEKVTTASYSGARLKQRRWDIPTERFDWGIDLHLYRMRLGTRDPGDTSFAVSFDAGNMGLRRFANLQDKPREVEGLPLHPGTETVIPAGSAPAGARQVVAFLPRYRPPGDHWKLTLATATATNAIQPAPLLRDWYVATLLLPQGIESGKITVTSSEEAVLADLIAVSDAGGESLLRTSALPLQPCSLQPFTTRWVCKDGQFCLPVSSSGSGLIAMLQCAPEEVPSPLRIGLKSDGGAELPGIMTPPGKWVWCVWPASAARVAAGNHWFTVLAERTFDPGVRGYPSDLLTHVGALASIP